LHKPGVGTTISVPGSEFHQDTLAYLLDIPHSPGSVQAGFVQANQDPQTKFSQMSESDDNSNVWLITGLHNFPCPAFFMELTCGAMQALRLVSGNA
jgi:hypothetical protein